MAKTGHMVVTRIPTVLHRQYPFEIAYDLIGKEQKT
jgi:hypothetical protein